MSQAELIAAIQYYLNHVILRRPVEVTSVSPRDETRAGYMLHVEVESQLQENDDA
jgi:negative regulator of sigma E activity